jgi:HSP20 family protein
MAEVNVQTKHDGPKHDGKDSQSESQRRESPGIATREGPHAMRRDWAGAGPWRGPFDLVSANPFAMLRRLNEEMDRAFYGGLTSRHRSDWIPAIDVTERNGQLQVRADLPGVQNDDLKVEISGGALNISGERKQEHEEDSGGFHRVERSYGSFFRSIPLPDGTNIEQARAQFNNGVLEVSVPLPRQQQNIRQIPVESVAAGQRRDSASDRGGAQSAGTSSGRKEVASEGANPGQKVPDQRPAEQRSKTG